MSKKKAKGIILNINLFFIELTFLFCRIVSRKIGYLFVGQMDQPFARMKYRKELKDLDNKIIECKFENNEWKFMRERTDKSYPNSHSTAIGKL